MEASIELRELKPFEEEKEVSLEDKVRGYVQAIDDIAKSKKGLFKRKRAVKEFVRENPSETDDLVDYYKSKAGVVERATTWGKKTRVQKAVREYEISQNPSVVKRFIKRHPAVLPSVLATQGLISALSPSHPLMVDAYLADRAVDSVKEIISGPKVSDEELGDFLTTKEQALRYEADVLKDLEDLGSEKVFSIVEKEGKLEQKDVRTMNSLISKYLPFLNLSSDNNGIPRLEDKVDLWLQGYDHIASGHYHVFGEAPSQGDLFVSKIMPGREVVVVNGIAPQIHLNGGLVSYKLDTEIPEEVLNYFMGRGMNRPYLWLMRNDNPNEREDYVRSFISYACGHNDIDVIDLDSIKSFTMDRSREFLEDYRANKSQILFGSNSQQDNYIRFIRQQNVFYSVASGEEPNGRFQGIKNFVKRFNK